MLGIFTAVAVVALLVALFIPEKKGIVYSGLDKAGFVLNIVLSLLYIPLSLAGLFMLFFADNPVGLTDAQERLLYTGIDFGMSTALVSIPSIFTSIVARKRGKRIFSFLIQFLPLIVFLIGLTLCVCATVQG